MVILCVSDILVGPGVDADKAESRATREATLKAMGIAPLSAYTSPMMITAPPEPSTGKPMSKRDAALAMWVIRPTPRKDAQAAGKMYYISDKPCLWNHDSRKYASTGQCVACMYVRGEALATAKERAKAKA